MSMDGKIIIKNKLSALADSENTDRVNFILQFSIFLWSGWFFIGLNRIYMLFYFVVRK